MDERGQRPAPANRAGERDSGNPTAAERRHDRSDPYRHRPGAAAAEWRTEGLDFVRDAIRLTYK